MRAQVSFKDVNLTLYPSPICSPDVVAGRIRQLQLFTGLDNNSVWGEGYIGHFYNFRQGAWGSSGEASAAGSREQGKEAGQKAMQRHGHKQRHGRARGERGAWHQASGHACRLRHRQTLGHKASQWLRFVAQPLPTQCTSPCPVQHPAPDHQHHHSKAR